MIWGWHYPFVTGEKGCFVREGFLQLLPPHLWACWKPHFALLVSLLFSYSAFPKKTQDFFLPEQINTYLVQDPTTEEWRAPACFRRGVTTCMKNPRTPSKLWGKPGLWPYTASIIWTEQTQSLSGGQGKTFTKSLPGHTYDSIKMRIHGPSPPLYTHFLLYRLLENM